MPQQFDFDHDVIKGDKQLLLFGGWVCSEPVVARGRLFSPRRG